MGSSRYSDSDYTAHASASYAGKSADQVFRSRTIDPELDPARIKNGFREAVDSSANPESTPIILCSDVTGSMGFLADQIIRDGLGQIFRSLYDRRPVTDPQILCAAVGDVTCDSAPLQVTQFEADAVALAKQLEKVYIEKGGGGNNGESYPIAWLFAGAMTKTDSFTKRGRKGYVFTIGDEQPHSAAVSTEQVAHFFGRDVARHVERAMTAEMLLEGVTKQWHAFHLIVNPVASQPVERTWRKLLGNRAILVQDVEHLADAVVACIEVTEGRTVADVARGRSGSTALAVSRVAEQLTTV